MKVKVKPITLVPCSGFNLAGEVARKACAMISEKEIPEIAETLCLVGFTKAAITKHVEALRPILRKLRRQKIIAVEGCEYECSSTLLRELVGIEIDEKVIVKWTLGPILKNEYMNKVDKVSFWDNACKEGVRMVVDAIKLSIKRLLPNLSCKKL